MRPRLFDDPNGFEMFWQSYPRHEAKRDALKAWGQLRPDADLTALIVAHLQTRRWPTDRRYIPLPATFLRGYRWTDEAPATGQSVPDSPANRWQPSATASRLIRGGMGIECPPDHGPVCATDLECLRKRQT